MSGSSAGGIVGGAIGFVVSGGNPIGAQIGFMIGPATGGYIELAAHHPPPRITGPAHEPDEHPDS